MPDLHHPPTIASDNDREHLRPSKRPTLIGLAIFFIVLTLNSAAAFAWAFITFPSEFYELHLYVLLGSGVCGIPSAVLALMFTVLAIEDRI